MGRLPRSVHRILPITDIWKVDLVLVRIWGDDGTSHDQSRDDGAEKGRRWR
jgi:hypothetical protein